MVVTCTATTAGLSYTTFEYGIVSAPASDGQPVSLDPARDLLADTAAAGRIFPDTHVLAAAAPLVK